MCKVSSHFTDLKALDFSMEIFLRLEGRIYTTNEGEIMKMFDYTCSNMPSSNNIAYMQIFTHASFYKKLKKDYRKKLSNVYINRTHAQASCFAFSLQFVKTRSSCVFPPFLFPLIFLTGLRSNVNINKHGILPSISYTISCNR